MRRSQVINLVGAICTAVVLVVVFATKIEHGAWLAVAAMIVLFFLMRGINRYYARVTAEVAPDETPPTLPASVHAVVLVSRLHRPALRALAFARASRPDVLEAVTMATDEQDTRELQAAWEQRGIPVPLKVLEAPYRDLLRPLTDYIQRLRRDKPRAVIAVYIPEYITSRWWQNLLHNQSALRIKTRLLFEPGVMVTSVPWQLSSTAGKDLERLAHNLSRTPQRGPRGADGAGQREGVGPRPQEDRRHRLVGRFAQRRRDCDPPYARGDRPARGRVARYRRRPAVSGRSAPAGVERAAP